MRRAKPVAVIAGAALFALAACGDWGGDDDAPGGEFTEASTQSPKDPERQGPAAAVEGATVGGTITVHLPNDPGPDNIDPTNGWSVTGISIQQALTSRSLTQYSRDADGQMILVPDLATDLGTPNQDFTEWTFTIRDDVKWETGDPITPEEVAWGICRSMDSAAFPAGLVKEYSQNYFFGAGTYEGPYTGKDPGCSKWGGVTVDGQDLSIRMAKPFPDMDYWGAFLAMGPSPLGKASDPPDYGRTTILSNGPYKVESFRPTEELVLVKNDQWEPETDPARHQYADKWIFKFNADQAQVDRIMLSDNIESQTSLSTALGPINYAKAEEVLGDRLVLQSTQCTSFLSPDYTKITDINVRKAIAYAYPYEDVWLAMGELPGVTRVPATSVMPPGMAGKREYFADGEQFTYNPEKAKGLLRDAGYEPGEFEVDMIFYAADPLAVAAQKVLTKGMQEAGFTVNATGVQASPYGTWLDPDDKLNKTLNLRGVNLCSYWPSGLTMLPPLLKTGAAYNTARFSEEEVDDRMDAISVMPLEEQAEAWGELDELIGTRYFPIIPTAFRNELFAFGSKIGSPTGDGVLGVPNYKDLHVTQ